MRTFHDHDGHPWEAVVRERPGLDYKGRYYFFITPESGADADGVALLDIRWNSERTAKRTLETMSETELRRRLRQAVGRGRGGPVNAAGARAAE